MYLRLQRAGCELGFPVIFRVSLRQIFSVGELVDSPSSPAGDRYWCLWYCETLQTQGPIVGGMVVPSELFVVFFFCELFYG